MLKQQASGVFNFDVQYGDITPSNYQKLASWYGATVPLPPDTASNGFSKNFDLTTGVGPGCTVTFTVPPGCWLSSLKVRVSAFSPE